jgi:hypothetical protein
VNLGVSTGDNSSRAGCHQVSLAIPFAQTKAQTAGQRVVVMLQIFVSEFHHEVEV